MEDSYTEAANLILDCLEEAFKLARYAGREQTREAMVNILKFYFVPRSEEGA